MEGADGALADWPGNPRPEQLRKFDVVVVLGPVKDGPRAVQLGGALRLSAEKGTTVVCIYPTRLEGPDLALVNQMAPGLVHVENLRASEPLVSIATAFYDYFAVYGRGATRFALIPSGSHSLAELGGRAAAFSAPLGSGSLYLIPFHVADLAEAYNALLRSALSAVRADLSGPANALQPSPSMASVTIKRCASTDRGCPLAFRRETTLSRQASNAVETSAWRGLVVTYASGSELC